MGLLCLAELREMTAEKRIVRYGVCNVVVVDENTKRRLNRRLHFYSDFLFDVGVMQYVTIRHRSSPYRIHFTLMSHTFQ